MLEQGDYYGTADDAHRAKLRLPPDAIWSESSAIMPPGAFSIHHNLVFHGSGANTSGSSLRSFAIHLRTDRSTPTPGRTTSYDYVSDLPNPRLCPILYQA